MYLLYVTAISLLVISGAAGQTGEAPTNETTTTATTTSATTHSSSIASTNASTNASTTASTAASTAAPISTSTATSTTTASPKTGVSYSVVDTNGVTVCIVVDAVMNFTLPYPTPAGVATISYSLPSNGSTAGSSCHSTWNGVHGQLLNVTKFHDDWTFELFFENSSNSFAASKLRLTYTVTNSTLFPNAAGTQNVVATFDGSYQNALFTSSISGYYSCNSASTTTLNTTLANTTSANVKISNLLAFAFGTQNSTKPTGNMQQCSADVTTTDYLVPIIVGCALAAIIIIVLVAYIIGRYRSRNTYQSV